MHKILKRISQAPLCILKKSKHRNLDGIIGILALTDCCLLAIISSVTIICGSICVLIYGVVVNF